MAKAQTRNRFSIALLGADTLLGRELQEVLKDRLDEANLKPYSASGEGSFGEEEGEAVYVEPLTAEALTGSSAAIIAGSCEGARKAYELAKTAKLRALIDCTGFLEEEPEARICSPLTEQCDATQGWLYEIAHPVAAALALALSRLAGYQKIRQIVAHIFEPASERGKRGISELQQQTVGLLSFKPLDKDVFDAQASFNMLPQYGEEAALKLADVERRIARHLATLLARGGERRAVPSPSLRVVQAPVFHGYSISLWVEFDRTVDAVAAGEALASAQIEVRGPQETAPDNVGSAGQSGLIAGDIRVDENNPRVAWFWIVGDNLRVTADAVIELLSTLRAQ